MLSNEGQIKLVDFGSSRETQDISGLIGTGLFMAPEMYRSMTPTNPKETKTTKIDIFSLGMILYYLSRNRKSPYPMREQIVPSFFFYHTMRLEQERTFTITPIEIDDGRLNILIPKLLDLNPLSRPSADDILIERFTFRPID